MFYSVASPDWKPGQPLTPAGALLFRTRSEAESFAPEAPAVAVAVRFDERRRAVRPQGPVASATAGHWSAPAVGNSLGGVTVFGADPRRAWSAPRSRSRRWPTGGPGSRTTPRRPPAPGSAAGTR